jgi:putative ABC transport system permease protein
MNTTPPHAQPARRAISASAVVGDTVRGLRGQRRRIVPTFIAVFLGVAFTAGTLILTDTLRTAFSAMHPGNHAGIDVAVRKPASFGTGPDAQRDRIDASVAGDVAAIDGVAAASGRTSGWAQLTGPDGELLGDVSSGVDPVGENWIGDPDLNPWRLADGAPPIASNEVVIDRGTASELGVAVGGTVDVLALGGVYEMTVSGIATFGDADSRFGTVTALFDEATAQQLLGEPGRHDTVIVRVAAGASAPTVAERIERVVDADGPVEAVTGADLAAEAHAAHMQDWGFFDTFMIGFGVIALVVGGFIIFNTFSITVAQRTREFAMLRAIGAGRAQVVGSVLVESVVVGVVASTLGLMGGVGVARGLHWLFGAFGIALPDSGVTIAAQSLVVAFVLGVGITAASALVPALRAARVRPLAALREIAVDRAATSRRRVVIGTAILTLGAASMAAGLGSSGSIGLVAAGGLAVFAGSTVLGPVLVAPFVRLVGRPLAWLRGVPAQLARDNATRCPKRTAATAGALTIGVGLVGFITIMAASVKASIDEMVTTGIRADAVVDSNSVGFGGLDRSVAARLVELPEVAAVSGMSLATADVDGEVITVTGVDSADLGTLLDLGHIDGSLTGPNGSGLGTEQIAVNADTAAERGWEVGSPVDVTLADGVKRTLTVGAVIDDPYIGLPTIVDAELLEQARVSAFDLQVFVALRDGVDPDVGIAAVSAVVGELPQADVLDPAGFADNRAALIDPLLGVVYALLGFAVLIAALGIMNTLALSVMERTRELGVLRAIGASQSQVRTLVRWESVLIAGFGTLLGLLIGIGFGWAIVRALESEGITNLVIPASQLVVVAALAAATGVVAAVVPGRRAARLDVLDALRS